MSTPDPLALATWHGLDVAASVAGDHPGKPVLVSDFRGVVRWPAGVPIGPSTPVVEIVVQSDAVVVVSTLRRATRVLDSAIVRYPLRAGSGFSPDASAIFSPEWREVLASVVDLALALLPAPGSALTGP